MTAPRTWLGISTRDWFILTQTHLRKSDQANSRRSQPMSIYFDPYPGDSRARRWEEASPERQGMVGPCSARRPAPVLGLCLILAARRWIGAANTGVVAWSLVAAGTAYPKPAAVFPRTAGSAATSQ